VSAHPSAIYELQNSYVPSLILAGSAFPPSAAAEAALAKARAVAMGNFVTR
jgi:hypothetical protein